jgi:hypothetical protein
MRGNYIFTLTLKTLFFGLVFICGSAISNTPRQIEEIIC